ncbi:MAG TPA: hypothetical protein V6C97_35375 [Oculatellaceae cyanobacterium]
MLAVSACAGDTEIDTENKTAMASTLRNNLDLDGLRIIFHSSVSTAYELHDVAADTSCLEKVTAALRL